MQLSLTFGGYASQEISYVAFLSDSAVSLRLKEINYKL